MKHVRIRIFVALVSDIFSYNQFENAKLIAPINLKYLDIDLKTFPTDYFEEGDPFIYEINRTGIPIDLN